VRSRCHLFYSPECGQCSTNLTKVCWSPRAICEVWDDASSRILFVRKCIFLFSRLIKNGPRRQISIIPLSFSIQQATCRYFDGLGRANMVPWPLLLVVSNLSTMLVLWQHRNVARNQTRPYIRPPPRGTFGMLPCMYRTRRCSMLAQSMALACYLEQYFFCGSRHGYHGTLMYDR
jgi:hypothetical protein